MARCLAMCMVVLILLCNTASGEQPCKPDELISIYYRFSDQFERIWKEVVETDPADRAKAEHLSKRVSAFHDDIVDFSQDVMRCSTDRITEIYNGRTSLYDDKEFSKYQGIKEPLYYMGLATVYSSKYLADGADHYLQLASRMEEFLKQREQELHGR